MLLAVPPLRLRSLNAAPLNPAGDYVLYWMTGARRSSWNFALQHAVACARELSRPLLVFEPLACDYPWASLRLHRFVLDGMADNARCFAATPVGYYPYLEPAPGAGAALLAALAARACLVVGDDTPVFFLPRLLTAAARQLPVRLDVVDGCGLLPLRAAGRDYPSAVTFRRRLQVELPGHLAEVPLADPFAGLTLTPCRLPQSALTRWPPPDRQQLLRSDPLLLAKLPLDQQLAPVDQRGGSAAATERLASFLDYSLADYAERHNHPDDDAGSGLSPYLHFGQIAPHQIFAALAQRESWHLGRLGGERRGQRCGWWGMSPSAEAFLDQCVTWRELGYGTAFYRNDADRYDSLPEWSRRTLERHAVDPRPWRYHFDDLAAARTHDRLWNAAQTQLLREGRLHNYLRMLWGKKILEWSADAREALGTMLELNNRYALDGRDPNSLSGICWCLGRYDRPWGERPVYGTVRSMSSENTLRKVRVGEYLRRYAPSTHG